MKQNNYTELSGNSFLEKITIQMAPNPPRPQIQIFQALQKGCWIGGLPVSSLDTGKGPGHVTFRKPANRSVTCPGSFPGSLSSCWKHKG